MPTFVLAHTLAGHNRYVFAVAFSPDGRWLASSTSHGKIKLWEVSTGKEVRTLTGHTLAVYSVAFSPDGQQLVSAGRDATVTFWEVASGKSLRALKVAPVQFYAYSAAFSADGRWLAVGATGGAMRVWDAATGDCRCARLLTVGRHDRQQQEDHERYGCRQAEPKVRPHRSSPLHQIHCILARLAIA